MRLLGQFQASLFFLRKYFERKKESKPKTNGFYPLIRFCGFSSFLFAFFVFLSLGLGLLYVFVRLANSAFVQEAKEDMLLSGFMIQVKTPPEVISSLSVSIN